MSDCLLLVMFGAHLAHDYYYLVTVSVSTKKTSCFSQQYQLFGSPNGKLPIDAQLAICKHDPFVRPFVRAFVRSFIHAFVRSFIHTQFSRCIISKRQTKSPTDH